MVLESPAAKEKGIISAKYFAMSDKDGDGFLNLEEVLPLFEEIQEEHIKKHGAMKHEL